MGETLLKYSYIIYLEWSFQNENVINSTFRLRTAIRKEINLPPPPPTPVSTATPGGYFTYPPVNLTSLSRKVIVSQTEFVRSMIDPLPPPSCPCAPKPPQPHPHPRVLLTACRFDLTEQQVIVSQAEFVRGVVDHFLHRRVHVPQTTPPPTPPQGVTYRL